MRQTLSILLTAVFLIFLSGCDKSLQDDNLGGKGKLMISITDDPFDINLVESATVTITKVEIRRTGDGIPDGNPFMVLLEDTLTFDLLDLRNGVTEELVNLEVPAGEYDLVRLYVDQASLVVKDYPEPFNVKVPSGKQTGIKIFIEPALRVEGGLTSELLLDVDLSGSFVIRGNLNHPETMNGFIFKPVIRAANLSTAGSIEGMVKDTADVKIVNAKVWVMQDTVVATAYTDTLGYYAFLGIPSGTYSVYANKESYDTVEYNGVNVIEGNNTVLNFVLPPE